MKKQQGFTLIELVVVMVILGIIAAFAIPRFYDFRSQALAAVINGIGGSLSSANATAHAAALATGQTGATGSVTMDGVAVALAYGYPSVGAANIGIQSAMSVSLGSSISVTVNGTSSVTYSSSSATTPANCVATYTAATSASAPSTVTVNTTGC